MKITSAEHQGQRNYMEDRHVILHDDDGGVVLAVFDGHRDDICAETAAKEMVNSWSDNFPAPPENLLAAIVNDINDCTRHMNSGSSLSIAYLPLDSKIVWCAVLGDSPIIVGRLNQEPHFSPDHNVRTNEAEKQAAIKRGGFYDPYGYICKGRDGGLQMARALGNAMMGEVISKQPEIYSVEWDSFILVGTDGLFDPGHTNYMREALAVIDKITDEDYDAQALVDRAVNAPTGDNVTAILLRA